MVKENVMRQIREVWRVIQKENNRRLLSWLSAAVIGSISILLAILSFLQAPAEISFEVIRGSKITIPETGEEVLSFHTEGKSFCQRANSEFWDYRHETAACEGAKIILSTSYTLPHILDVSVQNNSAEPILISSVSIDVTHARQIWHPPAGPDAIEVKPLTSVVVESRETVVAEVTFPYCHDMKRKLLELAAGQSLKVVEKPNQGFTIQGDPMPPEYECRAELPFQNGEFLVESRHLDACEKILREPCYLHIGEFELRKPISFHGLYNDPVKIASGGVFRFSIELSRFRRFPNNMVASIALYDGEFRSDEIFFFRWDSGHLWALGESDG